ncbi:MAG: hypothetical protein ACE5K3_02395 [bacterium]
MDIYLQYCIDASYAKLPVKEGGRGVIMLKLIEKKWNEFWAAYWRI